MSAKSTARALYVKLAATLFLGIVIVMNILLNQHTARLRRQATYASLGVAGTLITAKIFAYGITGSVSLLSSLVDSLMDVFSSFIAFIGVAHAQKPADLEHRFGHGKAEALAALSQTVFIFISTIGLIFVAISHLVNPVEVTSETWGVAIMILSIVLTTGLIFFQRHVVKKTGSIAIHADHLHYTGDILLNVGVIASLLVSTLTEWHYVDPLFGLAVALYLIKNLPHIGIQTLHVLMDRELPSQDREKIAYIASRHKAVRGIHDIRTRSGGDRVFIEFHLELDAHLTLTQAHDIAHEVEDALKQEFPHAEINIHQEPAGLIEERLDSRLSST